MALLEIEAKYLAIFGTALDWTRSRTINFKKYLEITLIDNGRQTIKELVEWSGDKDQFIINKLNELLSHWQKIRAAYCKIDEWSRRKFNEPFTWEMIYDPITICRAQGALARYNRDDENRLKCIQSSLNNISIEQLMIVYNVLTSDLIAFMITCHLILKNISNETDVTSSSIKEQTSTKPIMGAISIQEQALQAYRRNLNDPTATIPWEDITSHECYYCGECRIDLKFKIGRWIEFNKEIIVAVMDAEKITEKVAEAILETIQNIDDGVAIMTKIIQKVSDCEVGLKIEIESDKSYEFSLYTGCSLMQKFDIDLKYKNLLAVKPQRISQSRFLDSEFLRFVDRANDKLEEDLVYLSVIKNNSTSSLLKDQTLTKPIMGATSIQEQALQAFRQNLNDPTAIIPWNELKSENPERRYGLWLSLKIGSWTDFKKEFLCSFVPDHNPHTHSEDLQQIQDDLAKQILDTIDRINYGVKCMEQVIQAVSVDFELQFVIDFEPDFETKGKSYYRTASLHNVPLGWKDISTKYKELSEYGRQSKERVTDIVDAFLGYAEGARDHLKIDLLKYAQTQAQQTDAKWEQLTTLYRELNKNPKATFRYSSIVNHRMVATVDLSGWFDGAGTIQIEHQRIEHGSSTTDQMLTSLQELKAAIEILQSIEQELEKEELRFLVEKTEDDRWTITIVEQQQLDRSTVYQLHGVHRLKYFSCKDDDRLKEFILFVDMIKQRFLVDLEKRKIKNCTSKPLEIKQTVLKACLEVKLPFQGRLFEASELPKVQDYLSQKLQEYIDAEQ